MPVYENEIKDMRDYTRSELKKRGYSLTDFANLPALKRDELLNDILSSIIPTGLKSLRVSLFDAQSTYLIKSVHRFTQWDSPMRHSNEAKVTKSHTLAIL